MAKTKTKEDETWESVEGSEKENKEENKVEYEVEAEEKQPETTAKETQQYEVSKENVPEELEGIETKGAQKRIRQLVKQRKDRDDQITQLIHQNEQLNSVVHRNQQDFTEVSQKNLDVTQKQLTDKLKLARTAYTDAFESGDKEKLLNSQEMLNDAQSDLKTLNVTKQRLTRNVQKGQRQPVSPQQQQPYYPPEPAPDPKAQDWATQNEWFGKDNVMTAAALAIDADLKEEGYSTEGEDFYQEVNKRIQEAFPHKFSGEPQETRQQVNTSKPAQVVAGASRSAPSSKKVKLSQHDLRLANKWNIPLEQYAAEKLKTEKAEGEYTTVNMKRGG